MSDLRQDGRDRLRCSGDDGANLIEYALLVSLIALVCVTAMTFFSSATTSKMDCSASAIVGAGAGNVVETDC